MKRIMAVGLGMCLYACVPAGGLEAQYTSDLEACLRLDTCEEYVKCRTEVAKKYGRPFGGGCDD